MHTKIRFAPGWMSFEKILRIETLAPAVIHWSDDWKTVQNATTYDVGSGIYIADLSTAALPEGKESKFTFYWPDAGYWQGADFIVHVRPARGDGHDGE